MVVPPSSDADSAIEIDPQVLDDDGSSFADFTDELNSFTTSCNSSITRYPVENGRRYHAFKPGTYPLPNDDEELERLNLVHHMIKKALGDKLLLAPFDRGVEEGGIRRVLDIGTGTGVWAIEMGDMYPEVEFLGNDLSPVQPSWVPPNVRWEVDDVESRWAYNSLFDFIFCRTLPCAVSDWPKLVRQVYDNVKPGGWVEFQDHNLVFYSEDGSYRQDSDAALWVRLLVRATMQMGKEPCPGPKLEGWVREAGFTNIQHQKIRLPIGPWPRDARQKEVGLFNLVQALESLEAFSMRLFTSQLGWTPEEVKFLCEKVGREFWNKSSHRMYDYHVVYAQKPGA